MNDNNSELEMRSLNVISSICGLFSHEKANSLLKRSFSECNEIEHKTDCMRTVLEKSYKQSDIFFSKLSTIIRLHSNSLKEKPELLKSLNNELKLVNLAYNLNEYSLEVLSGFEPYLLSKPYLNIDKDLIRDEFYKNVINEINWCYSTSAYSSTMVMIRKMFENLVKDLLRTNYKQNPDKISLYWKKDQFISFNNLINNLEKNLNDFQHYSEKINKELIEFLTSIKYSGNESSHTIEDSIDLEKLEELKKDINFYLKLLIKMK